MNTDRYFIRNINNVDGTVTKQVVKIDNWQASKLIERGEKVYLSSKQAYKVARKKENQ